MVRERDESHNEAMDLRVEVERLQVEVQSQMMQMEGLGLVGEGATQQVVSRGTGDAESVQRELAELRDRVHTVEVERDVAHAQVEVLEAGRDVLQA